MKYILIFSLFISTNLTGMLTKNVTTKINDDLYTIMAKVEQNKLQRNNGLTFLRECLDLYYNKTIELTGVLEKIYHKAYTNNECFLLYKQYLPFYKKCIASILPLEICKQIDLFSALLKNKKIKETYIKKIIETKESYNRFMPNLTISRDGHYFSHDIFYRMGDYQIKLRATKDDQFGYDFTPDTRTPLYFSPNNKYCIVDESDGIFFYNRVTSARHLLLKQKQTCFVITISDDSQHILFEGRDIMQSIPKYKLWTLDAHGIPQTIPLQDNLYHSMNVIFHPDNKHIIHNTCGDKLCLYNLETSNETIIAPSCNENICYFNELTLTSDNKKILAEPIFNPGNYILFNIENLDNVTSVTIPQQSFCQDQNLPVVYIPHKNMLTHITNQSRTLEILDEKLNIIASHTTTEGIYITALAVDNSGNYLAAGYSDGTIMIWNLFSSNPKEFEKIFVASKGLIKSLTFSENHLLFSQSTSGEYWGTIAPGTATLWDIHGNEIINFGDNIINSIISHNGKTIVIISAQFEQNDKDTTYNWNNFLTLATYQLDETALQYTQNNDLTLAQLAMLL